MNNLYIPVRVSFEDALRNLAAKLTGRPVKDLPRTQEALVQFLAENIPSVEELKKGIVRELSQQLVANAPKPGTAKEPEQAASDAGSANNGGAKSRKTT